MRVFREKIFLLAWIVLWFAIGCATGCHFSASFAEGKGTIDTHTVQSGNPNEPAVLQTPQIQSSTGSSFGIDQALATLKPLTWIGIAILLVGLGILVVGSRLPFAVPPHAGLYCVVAGGLLIATPIFLDRYSTPIFIVLAISGIGLFAYEAVKHNWFKGESNADK